MNKTTTKAILDQQELNRKLHNKENTMNNKTTEQLLTELNTMQTEHIKVLNERIEILQHTIEIDKITIQTQEKTIKLYFDNLKFINQLSNK